MQSIRAAHILGCALRGPGPSRSGPQLPLLEDSILVTAVWVGVCVCVFCHGVPRLWAKDRFGQSEVWYQAQGLLISFIKQLKRKNRASLVVRWLRILLPTQGTRV